MAHAPLDRAVARPTDAPPLAHEAGFDAAVPDVEPPAAEAPRARAQRRLPSMMIATCAGTSVSTVGSTGWRPESASASRGSVW